MLERPSGPTKVAISACLIGQAVRYDGTHAAPELPHEALADSFSYQPICPEVGIGMSIPRPPIALYRESAAVSGQVRVRQVDALDRDFTQALSDFAEHQRPQLAQVDGYILMKNSPSCGLYTVKVHDPNNLHLEPRRDGRGLYAAAVTSLLPQLPVEENERLFDAEKRYQFIHRVYAHAHWQKLLAAGLSPQRLIEFHAQYKYLLMAFSPQHYRLAGQLLSQLNPFSDDVGAGYFRVLMLGLANPGRRSGHVNALQHLQGYLKNRATETQRRSVDDAVRAFAQGQCELRHPLQLLRAALASYLEVPQLRYAWQQVYLDPLPPACF